jgi:DoxX-like family
MKVYTTGGPRGMAGLALIMFSSVALIGSAIAKVGVPAVQAQMARLGFAGGKLTFIAVLEIIGAAGLLWPRTRSIGLLWVSAYLGGAICAHVQAGEFDKALSPATVLLLAWIGVWLRHPQALWSVPRERGSETA